jgi:hypothetical protein
MSEKKQENTHSTFVEMINSLALNEDTQKNALDFAEYLKANGMISGGEHGRVSYKGECLCYIHLDGEEQMPGPWTIWTDGDYISEPEGFPVDEGMKEIAWANVNPCGDCGGSCSPGKTTVIFGREFDNVCGAVMAFNNPDARVLTCVKRIMDMRKYVIDNMETA